MIPPARKLNRTGKRGKQGRAEQQQQPPVFHPTIYRYTCTGALFLSSENKGSEGTCRGIQSRLELLTDLQINTRNVAIQDFTEMNDYVLEGTASAESSLDQTTKSIVVSPALIYSSDDKNNDKSSSSSMLPEEEIIKRQEWSCYGSTEVEYLVLKEPGTADNNGAGKEKIVALTPRNNGISIRKIEAETGMITNVTIGYISIVLDTSFFDDSATEQANSSSESARQQQQQQQQDGGGVDRSMPSAEEVPPRPAPGTIVSAKAAVGYVHTFSLKVFNQMRFNVKWLGEQVQDDFAGRTARSGHLIVGNIGKTVDKTFKFASKMSNMFWNPEDHDDDDE